MNPVRHGKIQVEAHIKISRVIEESDKLVFLVTAINVTIAIAKIEQSVAYKLVSMQASYRISEVLYLNCYLSQEAIDVACDTRCKISSSTQDIYTRGRIVESI